MQELWDGCVNSNSSNSNSNKGGSPNASNVISKIGYDEKQDGKNLEALLSRCDAFLQINKSDEVIDFIKFSKSVILENCSKFIKSSNNEQLDAHQTFFTECLVGEYVILGSNYSQRTMIYVLRWLLANRD